MERQDNNNQHSWNSEGKHVYLIRDIESGTRFYDRLVCSRKIDTWCPNKPHFTENSLLAGTIDTIPGCTNA